MKTRWFRGLAEDLATQIEHGRAFYLASFSILFIACTALRALAKPLWYDELFTYYMSRLPDMSTTWAALKDGADLNPPLLYIATRAAHWLLGDGLVATRLPAMLGFLVMLLCIFRFIARRCGAAYGFSAMLFTALSGAYPFAYEARPYGIMLGFCGLSLVAWQSAAEGGRRWLWVPGLGLSVAAALMTHCYAVLILIPLGLGELVRSLRRARVDWVVWLALAAPCSAALAYLPLLGAIRRMTLDNVTFQPTLRALADSYSMLAAPLVAPLIAALATVAISRPESTSAGATGAELSGVPLHEMALAGGFVLVPACVYLIAAFVSHQFLPRYGVAAAIGFSILFSWFTHRFAVSRRVAGPALAALLAAWFVCDFAIWMRDTVHTNVSAASKHDSARHSYELPPDLVEPDLPFVAVNGLFFLEADHYESPSFVSRLVYLADPKSAVRYTGSDIFDRGFPIMQKWFPIRARVEDYGKFVRSHRRFLVFGGFDYPLGWVIHKLLDDGAELRFLGQYHGAYGENLLLEVTMPPADGAAGSERAGLSGSKPAPQ